MAKIVNKISLKVKEINDNAERAVFAILSQGLAYSNLMTPVDTGFLVNSQFSPKIERTRNKISGSVGYSANYAAFVNYAPGTLKGKKRPQGRGYYWAPRGEPHFLEKGFEKIKPHIPTIVRAIMK